MAIRYSLGALVLVSAGVALAADPSPLDLAPPDTAVVIGINVEAIKASKLGQTLGAQFREKSQAITAAMGAPVLEMLDGVREALIVTTPEGLQSGGAKPAGPARKKPGLMLLSGTFTPAGVAALAKANKAAMAEFQGVMLYTRKEANQDPVSLALLNESLMVVGDSASVRACLTRRGRAATADPALRAKADELSANYHVWIATTPSLMSDLSAQGPGPAGNPQAAMLKAVRQISGGLRLGDVFQLDLALDTKSPQDAVGLRDMLNMLMAMGMNNSSGRQFGPLMQNLRIQAQGNVVRVGLAVSEQEIMKSMPARTVARQKPADVKVIRTTPPAERTEPEEPAPAESYEGSPASGVVVLPAPQ